MSFMKKPSLSGLLRQSPFKPIQQHMRTVFSCICLIPPLFDALYRKDTAQVRDFARQWVARPPATPAEITRAWREHLDAHPPLAED